MWLHSDSDVFNFSWMGPGKSLEWLTNVCVSHFIASGVWRRTPKNDSRIRLRACPGPLADIDLCTFFSLTERFEAKSLLPAVAEG